MKKDVVIPILIAFVTLVFIWRMCCAYLVKDEKATGQQVTSRKKYYTLVLSIKATLEGIKVVIRITRQAQDLIY